MDLDLQQLRALEAAVSEGTFEAAARALHVTPSAISQRLRALEITTGRVLLVRSKPIRVTPSGRAVLRLARQIQLLTAEAAAELGGGADGDGRATTLAVAVNADSLATWVLPVLGPLAGDAYFHLVREDEGRTSQLLREGTVVAAITSDAAPVAGCSVTPLGSMRYQPAAAPAFAERWFPNGPTPEALRAAPVVLFDRDDPLQHAYLAANAGPQADPPSHMIPSSVDFAAAVGMGLGWGMLSELELADGRVAPVTLLDEAGFVDVPLYWQQWRLRSAALDRLGAAIVAAARTALRPA